MKALMFRTAFILCLFHATYLYASIWGEIEPLFNELKETHTKLILIHTQLKGITAISPTIAESAILLSFKEQTEKASILIRYLAHGLSRWEEIEKRSNILLSCQFEAENLKLHMDNLTALLEFAAIAEKVILSKSSLDLLSRYQDVLLSLNAILSKYGNLLNKTYKVNWQRVK